MGLRHFFWGAALAATLSATLVAQQAPSGFHSISCVRVKPGQSAAFHDLLNGDYHKVEQASVDSGRLSGFIALRTVIPAGTDAACDWVLVSFYPGFPPAPLGDDEMTALLQKAGVASTMQQWRDRLAVVGELVSNNITQYQVLVGGSKKGDYLVFNSMKATDVNRMRRRAKAILAAPRRARGERRRAGRLGLERTANSQRRKRPEPGQHRRHLPELGLNVHLLRLRLHRALEEGPSRDDDRRCLLGDQQGLHHRTQCHVQD